MNIDDLIFPYDHILLLLMALTIIICFIKGFVNSFLSLLTWVGAILLTIYSYESLSIFMTSQILKINFFNNYEYLINIFSIIISIPLIFTFSLFLLKRIRKFLTSDLNMNFFGKILDKIFGFLYGLIFFYIIISTSLFSFDKFQYNSLSNWIINQSIITKEINKFNNQYIYLIDDNIVDNIDDNNEL